MSDHQTVHMSDHKTVYVDHQEGGDAPTKKIMSETDLPGMEDGGGKRKRPEGTDSDSEASERGADRKETLDGDDTESDNEHDKEAVSAPVSVHKLNADEAVSVKKVLDERIRSSLDDDSSSSSDEEDDDKSMTTNELLAVDPLYFRLNRFLQSDDGHSVANMMQKMIVQLAKLNELVEQKNAVLETKMIEQMAKLNSNMERLAERRSKPSEEEARA